MAGRIGRIDTFDHGQESWDSYSERLEQYFICNDVKVEKRVLALFSLVGGSTYTLLRGLTAPKKLSEEQYKELVKLLKEHFNPNPFVIAERFRFHKREQRKGESIREYLAAIRKLSEHCEFGTNLSDSLRDRLVCGLKSETIQRKLLSEATLTYETAVELVVAMETAHRDANELRGTSSVHKIYKQQKSSKPKARNCPTQNTNTYTSYSGKKCYRCTASHDPKDCKYKNDTCYQCRKKGHIQQACRAKMSERKTHSRKTHSVEMEHSDHYDSDSSSCIEHIELVNVHSTNAKKQDAIHITPKVNG